MKNNFRQVVVSRDEDDYYVIRNVETRKECAFFYYYQPEVNSMYPQEFKGIVDFMNRWEVDETLEYLSVETMWALWAIQDQQREEFLSEAYSLEY